MFNGNHRKARGRTKNIYIKKTKNDLCRMYQNNEKK